MVSTCTLKRLQGISTLTTHNAPAFCTVLVAIPVSSLAPYLHFLKCDLFHTSHWYKY